MKNLAKKHSKHPSSSPVEPKDGKRRTKLKPVHKQKYKHLQRHHWQDEDEQDEDLDLFNYLDEEEDDD
jgi:hypothetical protein